MELSSWFERQWTRRGPWQALLLPPALLFRAAAALRHGWHSVVPGAAKRLSVPVIVVGNISVGGTGKTPLVLWLASQLARRGHRPGIVSRGYRSARSAPRAVPADGAARDFGDEPLLLARRSGCPVWVGVDRVAAAQALLAANRDCTLILCDDGLQHYRLARDAEIAVVDGERLFGNGLPLPAGPLREPVSRLASVDAVVVNGGTLPAGVRGFAMRLVGERLVSLDDPARQACASELGGRRIAAVAGIGNPQRFFDHLRTLGLEPECRAFPDHYEFAAGDFDFASGATVLMTEKDAVKCLRLGLRDAWYLPVEAQVDEALIDLLIARPGLAPRPDIR